MSWLADQARKLVRVIIHSRRAIQVMLTVLISVNATYLALESTRSLVDGLDRRVASQHCGSSCGLLCAAPDAQRLPVDTNVTVVAQMMIGLDPNNVVPVLGHSSEVWWMAPRQQDVYCQWSWSQKLFDDADFDLMQLRAYVQHYKFATDDEATNPANYWPYHTYGKYYGSTVSDQAQAWLTYQTDPWGYEQGASLAAGSVLLDMDLHLTVYLVILMLILLGGTFRYPWGTLAYLAHLDGLYSSWFFWLLASIPLSLIGSFMFGGVQFGIWLGGNPVTLFILSICFLEIWIAVYAWFTEPSPLSPALANARASDGSHVRLPLSCLQTTNSAVAGLLALVLLPDRTIAKAKALGRPVYDALEESVNTSFLRRLSFEQIQEIRGVLGGASDEGLSTVPKPALAEKSSAAEGRRMSRPSIGAGPVMVEPQGEEGGGTGGGGGGGGGEVGSTASGMGSVATTASPTASPGIKKGVTFGAEVAMGQGRAKVAPDNDDKLRKPASSRSSNGTPHRRASRLDSFVKAVNVVISQKELWLLALSFTTSLVDLAGLLVFDASFVWGCKCSCDAGAETIADCYQRKMAANAAHRGYIGAIVFLPALLVRSAVLGRLWLDYYRVRHVRFASLEYVLRLEVRKRDRLDRALLATSCLGSAFCMTILLAAAHVKVHAYGGDVMVVPTYFRLLQQLLAGWTIYTETGFLSPHSLQDCPDISLAMRFYNTSEVASCRLMKLVFLSDEEIRGLQTASCWAMRHHRLKRKLLCRLSVEERLKIKEHLLRQDTRALTRSRKRLTRMGVWRFSQLAVAPSFDAQLDLTEAIEDGKNDDDDEGERRADGLHQPTGKAQEAPPRKQASVRVIYEKPSDGKDDGKVEGEGARASLAPSAKLAAEQGGQQEGGKGGQGSASPPGPYTSSNDPASQSMRAGQAGPGWPQGSLTGQLMKESFKALPLAATGGYSRSQRLAPDMAGTQRSMSTTKGIGGASLESRDSTHRGEDDAGGHGPSLV